MITALLTSLTDGQTDRGNDDASVFWWSRNPSRSRRVYLRLGLVVVKVVVGAVVGVVGLVQQLDGQRPAERLRNKRVLRTERKEVGVSGGTQGQCERRRDKRQRVMTGCHD